MSKKIYKKGGWLKQYQDGSTVSGSGDFSSLLNSTLDKMYGTTQPATKQEAPQVVQKPKPVVVAKPVQKQRVVVPPPAPVAVTPAPVVTPPVDTVPVATTLPEVKIYSNALRFLYEHDTSFQSPYYSLANPNYKKPTEVKSDDFNLSDLAKEAYLGTEHAIEDAYDATIDFLDDVGTFIYRSPAYAKRYLQKKGILDPDKGEKMIAKPVEVVVKKDPYQGYIVPEEYKELKTTSENYLSYYNIFDNRKGFNYVPTARVKDAKSSYEGVQGMAHFVYDYDFTSEQPVDESNAKKFSQNIEYVSGMPTFKNPAKVNHESPGSTVKDWYYTVYRKNSDGTVNIKYKKQNEFEKGDKIGDPLRQFRFTDINWDGNGVKAPTFNGSVKAVTTKSGDPTYFIYSYGSKDYYGKFGGLSVVFIVEGTPVVMDYAGSINQIKQQGEQLIKQFKIKPEDLIVAYHDLGSFSAKPDDVNGEILTKVYNKWNDNTQTGAGLAIPQKKQNGGWLNKYK